MRRFIFTFLCLLLPLVAYANPVILDPTSLIASCYVALGAFLVETGVVSMLLLFRGLSPLRVFFGYFVANACVFGVIFYPLLQKNWVPWPFLEPLVVGIDGVAIKCLAHIDFFQGDNYEGVTWRRAFLISTIGNAMSFFVGIIVSQKPWEQ